MAGRMVLVALALAIFLASPLDAFAPASVALRRAPMLARPSPSRRSMATRGRPLAMVANDNNRPVPSDSNEMFV